MPGLKGVVMMYKVLITFTLILTCASAYAGKGSYAVPIMSDLALMALSFVLVGVGARFIAKKRK